MTLASKEVGYTPPGNMPPYINIKRIDNDWVEVTVRGPMVSSSKSHDMYGPTAVIRIPMDDAQMFLFKALGLTAEID